MITVWWEVVDVFTITLPMSYVERVHLYLMFMDVSLHCMLQGYRGSLLSCINIRQQWKKTVRYDYGVSDDHSHLLWNRLNCAACRSLIDEFRRVVGSVSDC